MPYIPPPRPPPIPKPPPIPRPPPGPNLHMQQQQRFQQQQQQQQMFHQQQQKFHQQHQENIRRQNQQIQADNQRRQQQQQFFRQQQQQQLQRQQQQQQFQRQQEQFRRQQQEHHQRQQQAHRRQNQQQQQTFISSFENTSNLDGNTVVHVGPGITFQMTTSGDADAAQFFEQCVATAATQGGEDSQSQPSAPPTQSPPTQTPPGQQSYNVNGRTGVPSVPGSYPTASPPPYFGAPPNSPPPQTTPSGEKAPLPPNQSYVTTAPQQPPPAASTPPAAAAVQPSYPPHSNYPPPLVQQTSTVPQTTGPPPPLVPPASVPTACQNAPQAQKPPSQTSAVSAHIHGTNNRIVLKDGTQIVIQQEDEILFIGPTGVQMVVNCLPLYDPPEGFPTSPPPPSSKNDAVMKETRSATSVVSATTTDRNSKTFNLIRAKSESSISSFTCLSELEEKDEDVFSKSDDETLASTKPKRHHSKYGAHYTVRIHDRPSPTNNREVLTSTSSDEGVIDNASEESCKTEKEDSQTTQEPITNQEDSATKDSEASQSGGTQHDPVVLVNDSASHEMEEAKNNSSSYQVKQSHSPLRKTKSEHSKTSESDDFSDSEEHTRKQGVSLNYVEDSTNVQQLKRSSGSVSFLTRAALRNANVATLPPTDSSDQLLLPQNTAPVVENTLSSESTADSENGGQKNDEKEEVMENVSKTEPPAQESQEHAPPVVSKPPIQQETAALLTQSNGPLSTPPATDGNSHSLSSPPPAGASPAQTQPSQGLYAPSPLIVTLLPSPPTTVDPEYTDRSGWLNKLSHRKGMFGDKWQKRYFVLHRSWLYYFKKYGDSNPRGVIRLLPTGWSKSIPQGTRRMTDAVLKGNEQVSAIISVLRCFAVHRPDNFAASLSALLSTDGVADAFRSQTVSVTNNQHASRTFYMIATSNEEKDMWVDAINTNINTYSHSAEALTTACKELRGMLHAVNSGVLPKDIPPLLLLLHTRMKNIISEQQEVCHSLHTH